MRWNGEKVIARSGTPGEWMEIWTEEGVVLLRGYDPSLIEYESTEEKAEAQERAAEEEFERQMLEGYSSVTEMVAAIVSDDSPGRSGGPRQRAKDRLAELRRKRGE